MSSFRRALTITPRATGNYVDGNYIEIPGTPFVILASVQPASATEVLALPENRREKRAFVLYSDAELTSLAQSQNPDQVTIYGSDFEVIVKEIWQNSVINHYKYIVVKI